jgi:hypothetical protein
MITITINRRESVVKPRREWRMTGNAGAEKWDYVDDEWPQEESTLILQQNVDEIDLPAVIKAINKL